MRHYGLTRKYLGKYKYENVQPHHSWNSVHKRRKWLYNSIKHPLDYNHKPKRQFPLVKNHLPASVPKNQLDYAIMPTIALFPTLWRKIMNPQVHTWRNMYYPEIQD